jgi:hypothetical protein
MAPHADEARRAGSLPLVDLGDANGWDVWPLENGDWAWSVWVASNGGLRRSGTEASELEAEAAAQRELELMVSDATAAAQSRRELYESTQEAEQPTL